MEGLKILENNQDNLFGDDKFYFLIEFEELKEKLLPIKLEACQLIEDIQIILR